MTIYIDTYISSVKIQSSLQHPCHSSQLTGLRAILAVLPVSSAQTARVTGARPGSACVSEEADCLCPLLPYLVTHSSDPASSVSSARRHWSVMT